MPSESHATSRRRGRPAGSTGSREAILAAALEQFAEHGYARATVRGIAAAANVDPALVSRTLGSKRELFVATVLEQSHLDEALAVALRGPLDGLGERLVVAYLAPWEDASTRRELVALVRAALGEWEELGSELFVAMDATLGPDRPRQLHDPLALQTVLAQLLGVVVARHVLAIPPLAETPLDVLVARLSPVAQQLLAPGNVDRSGNVDGPGTQPERPGAQ